MPRLSEAITLSLSSLLLHVRCLLAFPSNPLLFLPRKCHCCHLLLPHGAFHDQSGLSRPPTGYLSRSLLGPIKTPLLPPSLGAYRCGYLSSPGLVRGRKRQRNVGPSQALSPRKAVRGQPLWQEAHRKEAEGGVQDEVPGWERSVKQGSCLGSCQRAGETKWSLRHQNPKFQERNTASERGGGSYAESRAA